MIFGFLSFGRLRRGDGEDAKVRILLLQIMNTRDSLNLPPSPVQLSAHSPTLPIHSLELPSFLLWRRWTMSFVLALSLCLFGVKLEVFG